MEFPKTLIKKKWLYRKKSLKVMFIELMQK